MRAARGLSLYLGAVSLPHLTSAGTSSLTQSDDIPEVGIGTVHPICDPLVSECISSDEEVQDDIIERLEEDDQITTTPNFVELGELLCDSLDEAADSTMLRFAVSSNETVIAERTSYSEFDGSIFTDNNGRKVWRGDVVQSEGADTGSGSISMTWATPCDVETFSLKMVTNNADGTTAIKTSVPCDAGSNTDICLVQYEADLPPPGEPLERVPEAEPETVEEENAGGTRRRRRRLTEHRRLNAKHDGDSATAQRRSLQSKVQVDVMILYSDKALERLGVSAEQMETKIADELPTTTEAAANSLVNLEFNLAHTGKLPYTQETEDDADELWILRNNAATILLRDQYQADLVVLVGAFPQVCGRGYLNPETTADDEDYGYSLVDANCLEGRTTSHEIGHNMGADHDVNNKSTAERTDYGHGYRYCSGDVTRYVTIMGYRCDLNPDGGSYNVLGPSVQYPNYFSNPDVSYDGLPTGTDEANNAQILRDNMEAVSNFRVNPSGSTCEGGFPGIQASDACCPTSCGFCGGTGCSGRDGGDFTGSEACCVLGVRGLGRTCSAQVSAPCVVSDEVAPSPSPVTPEPVTPEPVTPDETCEGGIPGIQKDDVCCAASCGTCGGSGCSRRDGGGASCCTSQVSSSGRICSSTVGAPCVIGDETTPDTPAPVTPEETCDGGIPGIQKGDVCCATSCGTCGGSGCSRRDGGGASCCAGQVSSSGRICSSTVGAPCMIGDETTPDTPAPVTPEETCEGGIPGIQKGDVCCATSCGTCGGSGCSRRDGGGEACCAGQVSSSGRICSSTVGAPCIIGDGGDDDIQTDYTCGDGILKSGICCSAGCGECGGSGCGNRGGGLTGDDCCQSDIRDSERLCSVTRAAPCVFDL